MTANKNMFKICLGLFTLIVISLCSFFYLDLLKNDLINNILIGLLTAFLVSTVIALIGYFNEKEEARQRIHNNIFELYVNLGVVKGRTGLILMQIHDMNNLQKREFENIEQLAEFNKKLVYNMKLELYDGFLANSNLGKIIKGLSNYKLEVNNLKNLTTDINIMTLKYDLIEFKIKNGEQLLNENIQSQAIIKNTITIKIAKLNEYQASLFINLEKLLKGFYEKHHKKYNKEESWSQLKTRLDREIDDLTKH